ncbi:MAG: cation:proton antiporter [Saprospiraceae bacterium]
MQDHLLIMAGLGAATLIMAWLPSVSKKIKLSYPIPLLLVGVLLYYLDIPLLWPDPFWPDQWLLYISEAIVIISLMGTGLKIGKKHSIQNWKIPLRLILITMPLTMLAVYFLATEFLLFSIPAAILLAAALAPTDPVLAAEVQIEDTNSNEGKNSVEFILTAEAGINDGLAFPFTFLAILVADGQLDLQHWFLDKFLLKILLGVAIGYFIGSFIGYLIERLPKINGISNPHGFVSLSITFMTYGIAELLHGYGFLAVFIAALSIRYAEDMEGNIKEKMHDFVEEMEKLLLVIWIILFGGSILNGILSLASWDGAIFAAIFIFLIRPLAGYLSLWKTKLSTVEKLAVSFCGIRGIGSIFYLSWAFLQTDNFAEKNLIYSIAAFVILFSILIHGSTAPSIMGRVQKE